MAASDPKALRKAAAIADGVIVGTGLTLETIEAALDHVRAGAGEAGRDWRDLDLWWLSGCRVDEDRATAEEKRLSVTAAIFNAHFRTSLEEKALPEELRQQATDLLDKYDCTHHIKHGDRAANGALLATTPDSLSPLRCQVTAAAGVLTWPWAVVETVCWEGRLVERFLRVWPV